MPGGRPALVFRGKERFELSLQAVQHANAFEVAVAERVENRQVDVLFEMRHIQVMDSLQRFAARPIHAFDLVPHVPITVLFSQLSRRAV